MTDKIACKSGLLKPGFTRERELFIFHMIMCDKDSLGTNNQIITRQK